MRYLVLLLGLLCAACGAGHPFASTASPTLWDKPALVNPITVQLSEANRNLRLNQSQDYILTCTNPVQTTWGLVVYGGHNVVLEGCAYNQGAAFSYGVQFKNQTGILWVHDVHFAGTNMSEGVDFQEPGSTTVVLRDVLVDHLHGSQATNHADCIQTWSGPQRLLIDGFTCTSDYQGLFLLPNQQNATTVPTLYDIRHVNLHLTGAYAFTFGATPTVDLNVDHVYVDGAGEPRLYPGGEGFEDVLLGPPPYGDYVTATAAGATGVDEAPVDPVTQ